MNFLTPPGLWALASVPALLWLWRLASQSRQMRVPSLIPYESLLRRTSSRRKRLVINRLFWLQLLLLLAATAALMQPQLKVQRAKTILAILDTSASMGAKRGFSTTFDQAKQALLSRIRRKAPTDQVLLLVSAPVMPAIPQPTSDAAALVRAIEEQRVSHLGGHLATTERLGRAILGKPADEIWVATDEPAPPGQPLSSVHWLGAKQALPNVAIVGIDSMGPLCESADARLMVTVQNFSETAQKVRVTAKQQARLLAEESLQLSPQSRRFLALPLPQVEGLVEVQIHASADALSADDRAWAVLQPLLKRSIIIRLKKPAAAQSVARWLSACPALSVTADEPAGGKSLLITDDAAASAAAPLLLIQAPGKPQPVASYWMAAEHPVASYLAPLSVVAAPIGFVAEDALNGTPAVSAIIGGRKTAVVVADESQAARRVVLSLDVAGQELSTPVTLVFFNSLRWLMGSRRTATTRDGLLVDGWDSGDVSVHPPQGASYAIAASQGVIRDETAVRAGIYRLTQGGRSVVEPLNFIDPLESNLMDNSSTWTGTAASVGPHGQSPWHPLRRPSTRLRLARDDPEQGPTAGGRGPRRGVEAAGSPAVPKPDAPAASTAHPLAPVLILLMMGLLIAEWWFYGARAARRGTASAGQAAQ